MALEGTHLGRYHLVRLLGSGGMGEVYLAEDPRIRQQVAIKVMRAEPSPYPNAPAVQTAARLFQREARAIVALDHAHILPLHDYGEAPQGKTRLLYLVMPYRPEGSLVDWVQQQYPHRLVPPEVVAHMVSQAADAIQHAHDHQIIHADVKPSNFLMRTNPKTPALPDLFLGDFGIARMATETANTSQAIRGTPTYMAPEQCEGEAVPASDQYALAVMAYELLTGRPPFQGNALRLMYHHVNTAPTPPSAHTPRLSKALDEVILTALAKRPDERFRSVTAFATALQNAVQELEVAEAPTQISPQPKITAKLPAISPSGHPLADLPTYITPLVGEAALTTPAPATAITPTQAAPALPEPATQAPSTQEALATGTTAPPHPETTAALASQASELLNPPAAPALASVPTASPVLPQPATLDLAAGHAPTQVESEGGTPHAGPVAARLSPLPTAPATAHRRLSTRRWLLMAAAVLGALALVAGGAVSALPRIFSTYYQGNSSNITPPIPVAATSATVTITSASKNLQNTFTLSAVTGTPDASKKQVGARVISVTTPSQTKTVPATGNVNFPGTHEHGTVQVANYNPTQPLVFAAGDTIGDETSCVLPIGKTGPFYLMFDAPVSLPPDPNSTSPNNPPTAFVPGHIVQVGSWGGCFGADGYCASYGCYLEIQWSNVTLGQDPYNGPVVQQSDIDGATNSLISANRPNPQQVIQPQIKPNEQQIGTPQCTPNTTADHNAGDWAAQVKVSVTFTCTGEVYDYDAAVAMAANLLTQQAATDPGAGYALVGKINTTITNATLDSQGTVTLTVTAEGVWAYQFIDAQKQALARLIAGKSPQEAQRLLMNQPGVEKASITLSGSGQNLPSDPSKITIVVQAVQGL